MILILCIKSMKLIKFKMYLLINFIFFLVFKDLKVMIDFKEWINCSFCFIGCYCIIFFVIEI